MKHKRYEIAWRTCEIRVYVNGDYSHSVNFAAALDYQRDIVAKLLASLHRNKFEMVSPASDGAWVYEGYAL
jgi:hypothetical protein